MSHSEFGDLWREYMNAFAECLLEMHSDENSPAGQRLVRFTRSLRHSVPVAALRSFLHFRVCAAPCFVFPSQGGAPDEA